MSFKTAVDYKEGLKVLVVELPEIVSDRLLGTVDQIERCEGSIPIQNWCPMCLGKMLLMMKIVRAERAKLPNLVSQIQAARKKP